jgi:hypothetical protein
MYFLNIFPETLHVSADVSHHQVYATTSRNTGDNGITRNEIKPAPLLTQPLPLPADTEFNEGT